VLPPSAPFCVGGPSAVTRGPDGDRSAGSRGPDGSLSAGSRRPGGRPSAVLRPHPALHLLLPLPTLCCAASIAALLVARELRAALPRTAGIATQMRICRG
jgi:hypothetical protein